MKFLVITQSEGKRRVGEHECASFSELHSKLTSAGVKDFRIYCEVGDLVESLSIRVEAIENQLTGLKTPSPRTESPANGLASSTGHGTSLQSGCVKVELVAKHLILQNYDLEIYEDRILFELRFHNISKDKIRALKGDLVFSDLFDEEVFRIGITMNEPVLPGKSCNWSGGFAYNQFLPEHVHFAGFKAEDMHVHLENERVVT